MLVVWALTGLWHGASWNFVLWGAYYGVLLILERFVLAKALEKVPKLLRWLMTFVIVLIGWIIFYYTDFAAVGQHLLALVGVGGAGWIDAQTIAVVRKYTVFPLLCLALSLPWVPALGKALPEKLRDFLQPAVTVILFAVSVLFLVGQSYNPFIYFRF